eukprot:2048916-Amphidinium_carterae.1
MGLCLPWIPAAPTSLALPWEVGLASSILGSQDRLDILLPPPSSCFPEVNVVNIPRLADDAPRAGAVAARVHRATRVSWKQQGHAARDRAIERWRLILASNLRASNAGRTILREATIGEVDSIQRQLMQIRDILAPKATSTVAKRAGPITKYMAWCHAEGKEAFPFTDDNVYQFLSHRREDLAPTFASQFIESVNFAGFVLGLDGSKDINMSPRIRGLAADLLKRKRALKQVSPLEKDMVAALEVTVKEGECVQDAVIAGQCLFCVYARARWSDAQHVERLFIDGDVTHHEFYLQGEARDVKTSSVTKHTNQFLPMVAPSCCLSGPSWIPKWMQLRDKVGLSIGPGIPMLPVPLTTGGFGDVPLSTGEAARWMREILVQRGISENLCAKLGTHSLKATMLSWSAKFGIPREVRQILGYHVVPGVKTVLHYSRDEQTIPLRRLAEVISQVACGAFHPDANKSGRFVQSEPKSAAAVFALEADDVQITGVSHGGSDSALSGAS